MSDRVSLREVVQELEDLSHAIKTGGITDEVKQWTDDIYFAKLGRALNAAARTFEQVDDGTWDIANRPLESRDDQKRKQYLTAAMGTLGKAVYDRSIEPAEAASKLSDTIEGLKRISYQPAKWFQTQYGMPASRLRKARQRGQIDAYDSNGKGYYSVSDAERLWPDDCRERDNA